MITYVKGTLAQAAPHFAVIDVGGIGYQVLIPASAFSKLPAIGSEILLHTAFVIRELSHTLYGFVSADERDLFLELIGVTGIGPKIALSLIGHLSIEEMHSAIGSNDIAAISKVPGLGKKTAQKLILEMRDKLAKSAKYPAPAEFAINIEKDPQAQKIIDAMNALINLGYNQATAQKAIKKSMHSLPESIDLATLITDALKNV